MIPHDSPHSPKPDGSKDDNGREAALGRHGQRLWLADLSIRQPVFITMVVLALAVIGIISYGRMGLGLLPDVSFPVAAVRTVYPGANPEEVERSVTKVIEDAVISINGVDSVTSTSMDSVSLVLVQFNMDKNDREAVDDVRMRVNTIRNALPDDVQEPVVLHYDPSATPILSFSVADVGGKRSPEELRSLVDDVIKPRLEQVAGVAAVNVVGGVVREVHVDLDATKLQSQGIAPLQITQAIRAESLDVPAGRVPDGSREDLVRVTGQVRSIAQLGDIPIVAKPNGATIRVKDVATVSEGQADVRSLSRLDGHQSVVGRVQKQSGTNTVQVADSVKATLAQLKTEYPDLDIAVAADQSTFTRAAVQDVQFTLVLGAILAALVVLIFFRDLRNTLVTVAGLPVIVLGTFVVLHAVGISLNMISLMALSLSVGMLIDDAIVVRENIFRHMEKGEDPRVAASRGTGEIALAVTAVTSTIVAVFLPIAFVGGITGKFLGDFGITVAVAVLISLFEAFTLAPMLSAFFFRRIDPASDARSRRSLAVRLFEGLNAGYRDVLRWALDHRRVVIAVGVVMFAASLAVVPFMALSFVPETDQGEFTIGLELPPGSRLAETDRAAVAVERILQATPEVEHIFTTVGSGDGSGETANVVVKLRQRGRTDDLIARLRPKMEQAIGDARLTISRQSTIGTLGGTASSAMAGAPIQFAVQGTDFKVLDQVSADFVARLQKIPGAIDVDRSSKPGKPGQTIVLDRARAADLGISAAQVGSTVRTLLNGERASTYRAGAKDLDIIVRLAEEDRADPSSLLRLPLITSRGAQVTLASVASVVEASEPTQIRRENRSRQILVAANYLGRNSAEVLADARAAAASMDLPPGVTIEVTGVTKYQDEMYGAFGLAFSLALLFIYMILASQFGSFVHPFTIMLAVPFSMVGALLALFGFGFNFDMVAMIGIVLLMGLVTKNSILLVDFINQLRRRGLGMREAIMEAGPIRLRPILMTTLAMIFGMVPVALGIGAGSEMRQPMAISVIGGLVTSTALTLVIVPVVYTLIDDISRWVLRRPVMVQLAHPESQPATESESVEADPKHR
ncbi:MAG: efflux RND transporter permease subunit [Chloroflexota bacterium]